MEGQLNSSKHDLDLKTRRMLSHLQRDANPLQISTSQHSAQLTGNINCSQSLQSGAQ